MSATRKPGVLNGTLGTNDRNRIRKRLVHQCHQDHAVLGGLMKLGSERMKLVRQQQREVAA